MKVAILTDKKDSYPRPMAEGLARMLVKLGVNSEVFYEGLRLIRRPVVTEKSDSFFSTGMKYLRRTGRKLLFRKLLSRLKNYDLIVVVNHMPGAFLRDFMDDDSLRAALPKTPIILYDLVYLATRPWWIKWLKEGGGPEGGDSGPGNFGLERYNWYLCASVVSEHPMPSGPQPYSHIGINLDDGTLYPAQNNHFTALLDFERPGNEAERKVQVEALEETNTPYVELKGRYTIQEIRSIYRKCGLYFLAHRESFGLPICELQACGAYVFSPYSDWCPSHWIKEDLFQAGPGSFSENIVVYGNEKRALVESLRRVRQGYTSNTVRDRFFAKQPELFYGSLESLKSFLDLVKSGSIHLRSHVQRG